MSDSPTWIANQIGHREHYAVPRALYGRARLECLWTNLWMRPGYSRCLGLAPFAALRRLQDSYHADLPASHVRAPTWASLRFELKLRSRERYQPAWAWARNDWWAAKTVEMLQSKTGAEQRAGVFFCYGYGMQRALREARSRGLRTILGQIDAGPADENRVVGLHQRWSGFSTVNRLVTREFYAAWQEECAGADRIIVNSEWSASALRQEGVPAGKLAVVPLVFEAPPEARGYVREYPQRFTRERPLRVLFLGRCNLRKGVAETIEAAQRLADRPVEFALVGNTDIVEFERHLAGANIRYTPRVSRAECAVFFRWADVFLFPTHSDGFGLTQLEAQAWKLPIVASRFCGDVVQPEVTGWILPEVTGEVIADALKDALAHPKKLESASRRIEPWHFTLEHLGRRLEELVR